MADYYPLISRAVSGLDQNTGENRRVLYERARTALVNQLRGVEPALDEGDITHERMALEEAIRKVEAEAAEAAEASAKAAPPLAEEMPAGEPPEPAAPPPPPTPSLRERGLSNFRASVGEAEELGEASSEANRAAHERFDVVSAEHLRTPRPVSEPHGAEDDATTHYFEPPGESDQADSLQFARQSEEHGEEPVSTMPPPPVFEEPEDEVHRPVRSYGRLITILVLILVLAGVAGAGYWQRDIITSMLASLRSSSTQQAVKPAPPPPTTKPKIADRVQPSTAPGAPPTKPATAPAAQVAQKVVLYEEEPNNPQGKRYVGSAIWRTETVSPGPGLAPELAVRADVEIPERHIRMTWSLRRNTDKALPASHTIEIMFTLPADFDQGSIGNVPGVLMKMSETARGVPLAGLSVKVTNGYFLIGLSAVDIDVQRNIALLKERDWFDIPIVYTSGKRAILAMEKGTPGQRAFEEAFRAWGE